MDTNRFEKDIIKEELRIQVEIPQEAIKQMIRDEVLLQIDGLAMGILNQIHKP
jgi:hypothetical protein